METTQETLGLRLRMDRLGLPLAFFANTTRDVQELLRQIEEARSGQPAHAEWIVDTDNLQLLARPNGVPSEELQEILSDAYEGIRAAQEMEAEWPPVLTQQAKTTVQRLVGRIRRTAPAQLEAAGHPSLPIQAPESLLQIGRTRERYAAWSYVDGKLDIISVRKIPYFVIFEHGTDYRVRCLFPDDWMGLIKDYLGSRVTVEGYVHYTKDGVPTQLSAPQSLEKVPEPEQEDLSVYRGSMPGITGGLSSYEYIRQMREEGGEVA